MHSSCPAGTTGISADSCFERVLRSLFERLTCGIRWIIGGVCAHRFLPTRVRRYADECPCRGADAGRDLREACAGPSRVGCRGDEFGPPVPWLLAGLSVYLSKHNADSEARALLAKVDACIRTFNEATRRPGRRDAAHEA